MSFLLKNERARRDEFKKQARPLAKKWAMYRHNIEAARIDLGEYKKSSEKRDEILAYELEKAIQEWNKRLNDTKEQVANLAKNEEELKIVAKEAKREIKMHELISSFFVVFQGVITTAALTFVASIALGNSIIDTLKSPVFLSANAIVGGLIALWRAVSPQKKEFEKIVNEKINEDEKDIKNRIDNAAGRI